MKYDARGNVVEACAYDEVGNLVPGTSGFPMWRMKFDERGNVIESAVYGVDGKPCTDTEHGVWKAQKKYNERGDVTEVTYYDTDGKPCVNKNGVAIMRTMYNNLGRKTQCELLGLAGHPLWAVPGIIRCMQKYDVCGNKEEEAYFGMDDNPTVNKYGVSFSKMNYDSVGNLIEEIYLGEDGKPRPNNEGVVRVTTSWASKGKMAKRSWSSFGKDGKPYVNQTRKFNEDGDGIEDIRFDETGKRMIAVSRVTGVVPGGQAARLGIQVGDLLLQWGAWRWSITNEFQASLAEVYVSRQEKLSKTIVVARVADGHISIVANEVQAGKVGTGWGTRTLEKDAWKQVNEAYQAWLKVNPEKKEETVP